MSGFNSLHPRARRLRGLVVSLLALAVTGGGAAPAVAGPPELQIQATAATQSTWTPARMQAAIANAAKRERRRGRKRRRADLRWIHGNPTARPMSSDLPGTRVIGRLFSKAPDGSDLVCSATLVESANRSVVWTAGHCVHGGRGSGPHTDFAFVPGYRPAALGGPAPFGVWPGIFSGTTRDWARTGDNRHVRRDVGGVVLTRDPQGRTLTDVLGAAQRISFGRRARRVASFGYPGLPPFDGESLFRCGPNLSGPMGGTRGRGPVPRGIACAQTAGASGGPWLAGADPATGLGTVVGVTSLRIRKHPWLVAPVLDRAARRLYRALSSMPN